MKVLLTTFALLTGYFVFSQTADFQADTTTICVGDTIHFQNLSDGGSTTLFTSAWDFGDGNIGTSNNETHIYTTPGTYDVTLIVTNADGQADTLVKSAYITVNGAQQPAFVANILSDCSPSTIIFTNNNIPGGNTTYNWDFGDGGTSTLVGPQVSHQYTQPGVYTVSLTLTKDGCVGIKTAPEYIHIIGIEAGFTADNVGGCDLIHVQFTDNSSSPNPFNPINYWEWDFGNGNTFIGQEPPSQTYTLGLYDVTLIVKTVSGCIDTLTSENFIGVGSIDSVGFIFDETITCARTDVEFINTSLISAPHDPAEVNYYWDFQEGNSTEDTVFYQFVSDTGYVDVTLHLDFRGCKDSLRIDSAVFVKAPIAKFATYYAGQESDKACNPSSLPVEFTFKYAQSIVQDPAKTDNVQMHWFWGDGTDTLMLNNYIDYSLPSYKHKYSEYGTYHVTQVIQNFTTGCTDSIGHDVHVSWVNTSFSLIGNDSICRGYSLGFKDLSESFGGHPLNNWTYSILTLDPGTYPPMPAPGPPGVPVLLNGSYTYVNVIGDTCYASDTTSYQFINTDWIVSSQHSPFSVYLTAYNSVGCSSVPSDTISVHVFQPAIVIGASDLIGCPPLYDSLFNKTCLLPANPLPIESFVWHFPNEIDSVVTYPASPADYCDTLTHTLIGEGNVEVTLTATDAFGCKNTQSVQIKLTKPQANFMLPNYVVCNNDSLFPVNTTLPTDNIPIDTSSWFFLINGVPVGSPGDSVFKAVISPIPSGQTSVVCQLALAVEDTVGCKDTLIKTVTISLPKAIPTIDFTGPEGQNFICLPNGDTTFLEDHSTSFGAINTWTWNITPSSGWDFADGTNSSSQNPTVIFSQPGNYDIELTVVDEYGCEDNAALSNSVPVGGNLDAVYTVAANPAETNENVVFTDASTPVASITKWIWNFGDSNDTTALSSLNPIHSYAQGGAYNSMLIIEDAAGCRDTASVIVIITAPDVQPPNVFTPNGDGINDYFELPYALFKSFNVSITNRWGNVLYHKDNQTGTYLWDGVDVSGQKCHDGVYFYRINGETTGGNPIDITGFVTISSTK
jgi:gliding motility-associated-like protein